MKSSDVIIIGGGISGLAALHWLRGQGIDARLLERRERPGGVMWSSRRDDKTLAEAGPNSVMLNPDINDMLADLGLEGEVVHPAKGATARYIMRAGQLVALPSTARQAFGSPILSRRGRRRLLREFFVKPAPPDLDESVATFVERRFGREALDYLVDPFVAGVYAGRPEALSLRHAFPTMHNLEQEQKSLLRAAIKKGRRSKRSRRSGAETVATGTISFREGMATLPRGIAGRWGEWIVTGVSVDRVEQWDDGWMVTAAEEQYSAPQLIIATEAHSAAELISALDADLSQALGAIDYAPVAVAISLYDRASVVHPLNGFGMLIPSVEKRNILGTIFSSSLFEGRAPEGQVLLTTFIGGSRSPELVALSDAELEYIVHSELRRSLGIFAPARSFSLHRWRRAIPQYKIGYGATLDAIREGEERHTGLHFLGNYCGGISVGGCVASARELARTISGGLAQTTLKVTEYDGPLQDYPRIEGELGD